MVPVCALLAVLSGLPQEARIGMVVARRNSVTAAEAQVALVQLGRLFNEAGVRLAFTPQETSQLLAELDLKDPATCAGRKACLVDLGRELSVSVLIAVSLGQFEGDRGLGLEALEIPGGALLAQDSMVLEGPAPITAQHLQVFLAGLEKALEGGAGGLAPLPPVSPPRVEVLPPSVVAAPAPARDPRLARYLLLGAGVVATSVGAIAGGLGAGDLARLNSSYGPRLEGLRLSTLRGGDALALNASASRGFVVSGVCIALAATFLGLSAWLW